MHSRTLARGIATGAVLVAAALVLVARTPSDAPPAAPADEGDAAARVETDVAEVGAEPAAPQRDTAAADKIRELEAMSETFRNSTFLIAIRDAGFVCDHLLRVSGGLDGSAKWMATCSETMAYTVGVAGNGALHVEPFLQYFDGLAPPAIELRFERNGERMLPPRLPPQPR